MEHLALDYLTDLQRAQLVHWRPELRSHKGNWCTYRPELFCQGGISADCWIYKERNNDK